MQLTHLPSLLLVSVAYIDDVIGLPFCERGSCHVLAPYLIISDGSIPKRSKKI